MFKNVFRISPNRFRLLSDVHTNVQERFTNGTELFSINDECFMELFRNDSECSSMINDKVSQCNMIFKCIMKCHWYSIVKVKYW